MDDFKVNTLINKDDVYCDDNKGNNTFKSVDELISIGINKNSIYRQESMRKRRNEYSHRRYICK